MFDVLDETIFKNCKRYSDLNSDQKKSIKDFCDDDASYQVLRNLYLMQLDQSHPSVPPNIKENLDLVFEKAFPQNTARNILLSKRVLIPLFAAAASLGLFLILNGIISSDTKGGVITAKINKPKPKTTKKQENFPSPENDKTLKPRKIDSPKAEIKGNLEPPSPKILNESIQSEWGPSLIVADDIVAAADSYAWSTINEKNVEASEQLREDLVLKDADNKTSDISTPIPGAAMKSISLEKIEYKTKRKSNSNTQEMLDVIKPLY